MSIADEKSKRGQVPMHAGPHYYQNGQRNADCHCQLEIIPRVPANKILKDGEVIGYESYSDIAWHPMPDPEIRRQEYKEWRHRNSPEAKEREFHQNFRQLRDRYGIYYVPIGDRSPD